MVDSKKITDYECSICYELLVQPAQLPCTHHFCIDCVYSLQDSKMTCPLCRKELDTKYEPSIDNKKQKEFETKFPKDYETLK